MQIYNGKFLVQPIFPNGDSGDMPVLEAGVTPVYSFQYIMLKIYESHGDSTLQFSKMQFLNQNGKNFLYPNNCSTETNNVFFFRGEDLTNVLINDNTITEFGKACFHNKNAVRPDRGQNVIKLKIDLKSQCLNLKTYNRWVWYTSNDTSQSPGRNMRCFELFVSNTGNISNDSEWISVDKLHSDTKSGLPSLSKDRTLAYTGNIKVY